MWGTIVRAAASVLSFSRLDPGGDITFSFLLRKRPNAAIGVVSPGHRRRLRFRDPELQYTYRLP
jgi:hypothetical protein